MSMTSKRFKPDQQNLVRKTMKSGGKTAPRIIDAALGWQLLKNLYCGHSAANKYIAAAMVYTTMTFPAVESARRVLGSNPRVLEIYHAAVAIIELGGFECMLGAKRSNQARA